MKWVSTADKSNIVNLQHAILYGLPNDGGLWVPQYIPTIDIEKIDTLTNLEICLSILKVFFSPDIDETQLKEIVDKAINFDIPLQKLNENTYILELFHGPTMAFKDFGARIMALLFQHFLNKTPHNYKILVATSGDTGSAVANAFSNTNIPVLIFYPNNKISEFQKQQITTYGKNISSMALDGSFDDCQAIVKSLLNNDRLQQQLNLRFITANSINISRLIPQMFYYYISYAKIVRLYTKQQLSTKNIIYSIPSGNMGNATACLLSILSGLSIDKMIIATNSNDTIPRFILSNGLYQSMKSISTISNAMDVGNPSNFQRLWSLLHFNIDDLQRLITGISVSDSETQQIIKQVYETYNYLLDPHTAVGYQALEKFTNNNDNSNDIRVVVSTASPYKFKDIVEHSINKQLTYPTQCISYFGKKQFKFNYHSNTSNLIEKIWSTNTIILIGMPGSGKSTIAKYLQTLYQWNLIETDQMIIDKYNKKLVDIVNHFGDRFMEIEKETILTLTPTNSKTVISPGGSVVYNKDIMEHLKSLGIIIHLDTNSIDIEQRVDNFLERGIVMKPDDTIYDLYRERLPLYHQYRELSIDNSILNIEETANTINNL